MALEKIEIQTLDPAATIVVATGNAHKLVEIEAILGAALPGVRFVSIKQLGDFEDPEETGTTFAENALIKARAAVAETGFAASRACIRRAMPVCTAMTRQTTPSFCATWQMFPRLTAPRAL